MLIVYLKLLASEEVTKLSALISLKHHKTFRQLEVQTTCDCPFALYGSVLSELIIRPTISPKMKKFALAARKVSEGGSGSADEGSPKKGEKGKKSTEPDAASIREQKKQHFEDVICFE